jgi:hypothetical protein
MLRLPNPTLAAEARQLFARDITLSTMIDLDTWRNSRSWWKTIQQRWAYFILAQLDPVIAHWQYTVMPNQT